MQCGRQVQIFQMYLPASIFHLDDAGGRFLQKIMKPQLRWSVCGLRYGLKTFQMLKETVFMGPHWCAAIKVSKFLLPVTTVNYTRWGRYSNRGRTQCILKVIQHNPRQGFLIRHVTLFHHIFMILTTTNCCVHIKIHFTTITTSIYLNTMHEQLTFISSALHSCDR
jgi:hypothetical protein